MKRLLIALNLIFIAGRLAAQNIPTPDEVFGHQCGADFKIIGWDAIVDYYRTLDERSPRIAVQELGKTHQGRPFIVAAISSEENMARLDEIKQIARSLALGDPASDEQMREWLDRGRGIVLITQGIHASEFTPTQASPELAYRLITEESDEMQAIRRDVVTLVVPCFNPDGLAMEKEWYDQWLGTPYEGSGMPWIYHPYVGHDNNRDAYMLSQPESQYVNHLLYQEWYPQIYVDQHHMGNSDARIFIGEMYEPLNPSIDPLTVTNVHLVGAAMRGRLESEGKPGVIHRANWDGFWQGGFFTNAWWHNVTGILTEVAATRMATPVFQTARNLDGSYFRGVGKDGNRKDWNLPNPWKGGWWRPRDCVEYNISSALGALAVGSHYKTKFLRDIHTSARRNIATGESQPPYGFAVPVDQHDPASALKFLEIVRMGGGKIERAEEPFTSAGVEFPEGTYVVPVNHAYRPYLLDMFMPQEYPAERNDAGEPILPFDWTGWTLAFQMGVKSVALGEPLDFQRSEVNSVSASDPELGSGAWRLISHANSNAIKTTNAILNAGGEVYWLDEDYAAAEGEIHPAGSILVRARGDGDALDVLRELRVPAVSGPVPAEVNRYRLRKPRLGLYQPWTASMDEGWTRFILEDFGFDYKTIHDAEIRAGDLRSRYDAIILPSVNARSIVQGRDELYSPPAYTGGIGDGGLRELELFVRDGGTLLCLAQSSTLPLEYFNGVAHKDPLADLEPAEFACSGAILRIESDTKHPIAFGMQRETGGPFTRSLAFEIDEEKKKKLGSAPGATVARYATSALRMSGFIHGADKLEGKDAVIEVPVGQGRVILYGFPVQFRGQPHGTFKLLFNAIHYSAAQRQSGD